MTHGLVVFQAILYSVLALVTLYSLVMDFRWWSRWAGRTPGSVWILRVLMVLLLLMFTGLAVLYWSIL